MPEGPELHLASLFVNRVCSGVVFTGPVRKSEVSKSPDVPFTCDAYRVTASSRGKEVKLTLTPVKTDGSTPGVEARPADRPMDIVFRFGMSGYFRFTAEDELPKHAHLRFRSSEKPCRVLSFVDARRFGSWVPNGTWQTDRGPCIMFEYKSFRENVLSHLSDRAFDRPICEVLLNQKYFNGIGNYLRAEILFRLNIPPFVQARTVLEGLESEDPFVKGEPMKEESADTKTSHRNSKKKLEVETADLLRLCHTVPLEVVNLGGKGYDPEKSDYSDFQAWLRCYYVDGMKSIRDHNGRTMWFKGDPGPMAPKDSKSPKAKKRIKKEDDHDYVGKKKVPRRRSKSTTKENAVKSQMGTNKEKVEPLRGTRSKRRMSAPKKQEDDVHENKHRTPRKRKCNSAEKADGTRSTAGPQRRSARLTRHNNK
ncbi:endonuclease 8-like 1 isoform X2 [Lampris incognitus]|uniref:endonuclease 8-like 1 isoform X2 n=1 Tax=Lampris incognitus TaxID=2546036 RepID=UPI0024B5E7C6|nr:endonuclease 8-like 1 isoform X2 [Lampris incognitus]